MDPLSLDFQSQGNDYPVSPLTECPNIPRDVISMLGARTMRSPSPSQLTATRIPKITDLREKLCYGDASLARCTSFIDDLRVFRKRHPYGTRLFEWKSSQDQAVLKALTTAFLDKNNFGEIYWPSDPDSRNFNLLQYSKDRVFIHRTLRQLLFRLNLQQYRNNKYKKKEQQPEPDPDSDNIIDHFDGSPTRPIVPIINKEFSRNSSQTAAPNLLHKDVDVSGVPNSPDLETTVHAKKRKLKARTTSKPAKRSKVVILKYSFGKASLPDPQQAAPQKPHAPPRQRNPDFANIQAPDQAIASDADSITTSPSTNIRQGSETVEEVLRYIRMNQPQWTSESIPPTPTIPTGQRVPMHSSLIDPDLERIISVSASSAMNQPAPIRPSPATICNKFQVEHQPLSPAPTLSRFELEPQSQCREISRPPSTSPGPLSAPLGTQAAPAQSSAAKLSTQAAASSVQSVPPVPPKSKVDFSFVVISSRTPEYQYDTWNPKGHFLEKSLSELLSELPFDNKDDVKYLTIRLYGPGVAVRETLACDADSKYEVTKYRFLQTVTMCLRKWNEKHKGKRLAMGLDFEAHKEEEDVDGDWPF